MSTPEQSPKAFELLDEELVHRAKVFDVVHARFRHADGKVAERDIVRHPGAVGVVAVDDDHVILVRQPREAVGVADVLELPAGRMDHDGEDPEATGRRELAEEIGKAGNRWEHLRSFWSSVGSLDEVVHLYLAEELTDASADSGEDERITIVRWPLAQLDEAIAATRDAKTIIGLLLLKERRARS